jgi:Thiamine monophosphate synthase
MIKLPRLYPIVDAAFFASAVELVAFIEALAAAGCTLIQYRNKSGNARVMLEQAREMRKIAGSHPVAKDATMVGQQSSHVSGSGDDHNPHFSQNRGEVGHPESSHVMMNSYPFGIQCD